MFLSAPLSSDRPCPCGSGQKILGCCGPYLLGQLPAPTAEALMRSRYSAYGLQLVDYLLHTEHPSRQKPQSRALITATAQTLQWQGLKILATTQGQPRDSTGMVEFVAWYQDGKKRGQLHERSQFIRENNRWWYVDGKILPPIKGKPPKPPHP